jgi:predicted alpha/beta superfamily hydrolase
MNTPGLVAANLMWACAALAQERIVRSAMPSAVLGEERRVIVHLPESYTQNADRRYPVVYVLDGTSQDGHTAETAASLARSGLMPKVIVVAIPNTAGNRPRDQTPPFIRLDVEKPDSPRGSGDKFLAFLKTELLPGVDRDYRTAPFRVLVGNSRGGLLVAYSLVADPELFDARFAFSTPLWREDAILVSKLQEVLASRPNLNTFLYMSVGERENENIVGAYHRTVAMLKQHAPKRLRWHTNLTPGADHQNNAQLSTPAAFKALYAGWRP